MREWAQLRYNRPVQQTEVAKSRACASIATPIVETMILEPRIALHEILIMALKYSGPQFLSKIFAALCSSVRTKLAKTAQYLLKSREKVDSFNKALVMLLRQFLDVHQKNCFFVQPVANNYNKQVHCSKQMFLASLILWLKHVGAIKSWVTTPEKVSRLSKSWRVAENLHWLCARALKPFQYDMKVKRPTFPPTHAPLVCIPGWRSLFVNKISTLMPNEASRTVKDLPRKIAAIKNGLWLVI